MPVHVSCFALVYLAASRWLCYPLNNSLGITHFVFALTGFVLLSVALLSIKSAIETGEPVGHAVNHWQFIAVLVGGFCFLLGCVTLAANCAWTASFLLKRSVLALEMFNPFLKGR